MSDLDTALISVLAAIDAVFAPQRDWGGCRSGNTYLARQRFAASGVAWRGSDTRTTEGQQARRILERLEGSGLLKARRGGKGRATTVRLTEAGEDRARVLCGLPGLAAGWSLLAEVARLTKRRAEARFLSDSWVAEVALSGLKNWKHTAGDKALRRELVLSEEMALPVLIRGWLASNSTRQRQVYYGVTADGWEALATREPPPDVPDDVGDPDARATYYEMVKDGIAQLGAKTPDGQREIGFVPLPVSMVGV